MVIYPTIIRNFKKSTSKEKAFRKTNDLNIHKKAEKLISQIFAIELMVHLVYNLVKRVKLI